MTTCLGKSYSFGLLCVSICMCASLPVGFEGGIMDLTVSVPGYCLSFY